MAKLSAKLCRDYGRGWSERNLAYMMRFVHDFYAEMCPISDDVTGQVDVRGIEVPNIAEEYLLTQDEDTAEAEETTDEALEMEVEE